MKRFILILFIALAGCKKENTTPSNPFSGSVWLTTKQSPTWLFAVGTSVVFNDHGGTDTKTERGAWVYDHTRYYITGRTLTLTLQNNEKYQNDYRFSSGGDTCFLDSGVNHSVIIRL